MAVNVYRKDLSSEIIEWVNDRLASKFTKVEELRTGAAYCQLLHLLYPGSLPLERVNFHTNDEQKCYANFNILRNAFTLLFVDKIIPIKDLVEGNFQAHIDFLNWFQKFFNANKGNKWNYDARAARGRVPMGYGGPVPDP